jgi:hypothetical protein
MPIQNKIKKDKINEYFYSKRSSVGRAGLAKD